MSGLLGPVTANQQMLAQALKAREQPRKQLTGQGLLDVAASGLGPVPIVGDLFGLGADASRFYNEPESRTPLNFGLAALGLLPFVPSGVGAVKKITQYEKAHEIAQRNAALPVEKGGLGLPPNNTAMDRARAMGFEGGWYHGTSADINAMNVEGKGKTSGAGAFLTNNPLVAETYVPGLGQGGNIMPLMANKNNVIEVNAKGRNWGDINTNDLSHNRKKLTKIFPDDLSPNAGTTTDEIAALAPTAGFDGALIRNIKDNGPNSHVFRAKEYLKQKYGIEPSDSPDYWDKVSGSQFAEARAAVEKLYGKQKADILAMQKPENIRSRFAAFDPLRRNENNLLANVAPFGLAGLLGLSLYDMKQGD